MPDRAQSETLGFALVLGVVLFMILAVTVAAYPGLRDAQDYRQVQNVEPGMAALADNVDALVRDDATQRGTRIRLGGGSLSLGDPVTVEISGTSVDGNDSFSVAYDVRPVEYRSGDGTRLAYVAGGVVRDQPDGNAVLVEPRLLLSQDHSLVTVVRPSTTGVDSVGSQSAVRVDAVHRDTRVDVAETGAYDVTIAITSPWPAALERSLERRDGVDCSRSGDTVTCTLRTDRIHVVVVDVDIRFR